MGPDPLQMHALLEDCAFVESGDTVLSGCWMGGCSGCRVYQLLILSGGTVLTGCCS